jgi:hypothetical protein
MNCLKLEKKKKPGKLQANFNIFLPAYLKYWSWENVTSTMMLWCADAPTGNFTNQGRATEVLREETGGWPSPDRLSPVLRVAPHSAYYLRGFICMRFLPSTSHNFSPLPPAAPDLILAAQDVIEASIWRFSTLLSWWCSLANLFYVSLICSPAKEPRRVDRSHLSFPTPFQAWGTAWSCTKIRLNAPHFCNKLPL